MNIALQVSYEFETKDALKAKGAAASVLITITALKLDI